VSGEYSFFDLQVNGYAGVDFNADALSPEQLSHACNQLQADGVAGILATIITDDVERMAARVSNLARARAAVPLAEKLIRGIHLEGPFINAAAGYVGAHPARAVRSASVEAMKPLLEAGEGIVRLVTLAPENDADSRLTRWLTDRGITVSAGHCNPSLDELRAAIDNGLSMFTHLGNGCPLTMHRHDNIVQRALSLADHLWICFIADGVHVPFVALRNYLKIVGIERMVVVSDAISAAGLGPGEFTLGSSKVIVDEQLATWSADRSHLMGSAMTMALAFANLRSHLGMTEADARRVTGDNPRTAIGLAN
jgi:N-acetylglucosamine-6-phosphate deacetylase